jgi:chemotaxis protein methyltransferase CheR
LVIPGNNEISQDFLENISFQKLKRLIHEQAGLDCSGYRDEYLKRRFGIRLRVTNSNTYGRYIIYLKKNPSEFTNLLNDLTINFTMFFRDTDVYNFLEKKLLPKIFQTSNPTRIWSAGCATGEEPYSLAILAHKVLGDTISKQHLTVYASDIDKEVLAKAAKGIYHLKQLNNIDKPSIGKYFTKESEEDYKINDFVKRLVHFEQFDLMCSPTHLNLDLILCRNVMIYFSKEGQQHIHMNFFKVLKNGGFFVTGKSEILSGEPAQKFLSIDSLTRCYQKPPQTSEPVQLIPNYAKYTTVSM